MIGPNRDAATVTPVENFPSYPLLLIAFTPSIPSPAALATAVPEIAAKTTDVTTLTCARLPFICPTRASHQSKILSVIPPLFMMFPRKMKNGIAISV